MEILAWRKLCKIVCDFEVQMAIRIFSNGDKSKLLTSLTLAELEKTNIEVKLEFFF